MTPSQRSLNEEGKEGTGQVKQMGLAEQAEGEKQPKSLTPGARGQPIRVPAGAALSTALLGGELSSSRPSMELVFKKCYLLSLFALEVGKETSGTKAAWSLPA